MLYITIEEFLQYNQSNYLKNKEPSSGILLLNSYTCRASGARIQQQTVRRNYIKQNTQIKMSKKGKNNDHREIINNIYRNSSQKKWNCIVDNCSQAAINSHLLQRNGILDKVIEGGHMIELTKKNLFSDKFILKDVGVKDAISISLFCNICDTKLFKEIETEPIHFYNYRTQLLFSYRATCAEIRQKEKNIEFYSRILNANTLDIKNRNPEAADLMKTVIVSSKVGIKDLSFYKEQFEDYLMNGGEENFIFTTIPYYPLKVCASAMTSPLLPEEEENPNVVYGGKVWNSVFINLIPQTDNLYVIIGYHKDCSNDWIQNYKNSWNTNNKEQQQLNISDLLATRILHWGISRSIHSKIPEEIKQKLTEFWDNNLMEFSTELKFNYNLFAHVDGV